jgi:hypothetical protein
VFAHLSPRCTSQLWMQPSLPPLTKLRPSGCHASANTFPSTRGSDLTYSAPAACACTAYSFTLPSPHAAASCVTNPVAAAEDEPLLGAGRMHQMAPPNESVVAIGCSCWQESSCSEPSRVEAKRRQWVSLGARAHATLLISLPSEPGMRCCREWGGGWGTITQRYRHM